MLKKLLALFAICMTISTVHSMNSQARVPGLTSLEFSAWYNSIKSTPPYQIVVGALGATVAGAFLYLVWTTMPLNDEGYNVWLKQHMENLYNMINSTWTMWSVYDDVDDLTNSMNKLNISTNASNITLNTSNTMINQVYGALCNLTASMLNAYHTQGQCSTNPACHPD